MLAKPMLGDVALELVTPGPPPYDLLEQEAKLDFPTFLVHRCNLARFHAAAISHVLLDGLHRAA